MTIYISLLFYISRLSGFNNELDQSNNDLLHDELGEAEYVTKRNIPHLFLASGIWSADRMVPARKTATVVSKRRVDFTQVEVHYPDPKTEPMPPPPNPFTQFERYAAK